MKNKKKGFTLVELLVVIAILAILATVSILGYTSFTQKAKDSNAQSEWAQYKNYVLAYTLNGDRFEITANNEKYTVTFSNNEIIIIQGDLNATEGADVTDTTKYVDTTVVTFDKLADNIADIDVEGTLVYTSKTDIKYESNGGSCKVEGVKVYSNAPTE